jgi:hypothetical protein
MNIDDELFEFESIKEYDAAKGLTASLTLLSITATVCMIVLTLSTVVWMWS